MGRTEKLTFLDRVKSRAFNHPAIAVMIIAVTAILGANQLADAALGLAEKAGVKHKSLALTQEGAKGDFSRQLTSAMYRRLFWADTYLTRVQKSAPPDDVAAAWQRYIFTIEDWTANLVNNEAQVAAYYGDERKAMFQNKIHAGFLRIHAELMKVKYPPEGMALVDLKQVEASIREVNVDIYTFATGLQPKDSNPSEVPPA
jgi:hypothetical protein